MLDVVMRGVGGLSSFPDVLGRMIEDGGIFFFLDGAGGFRGARMYTKINCS